MYAWACEGAGCASAKLILRRSTHTSSSMPGYPSCLRLLLAGERKGSGCAPPRTGSPGRARAPPARRKRSRIATHDAYLLPSLVMAFVVGWCRTSSAPGDRVAAPAPSWAPPWPGVHVRTAGEARMRPRHRQVRSHRIRTYGGSIIHSRSVTSKVRDARARPGLPSSSLLYCGVVTEELCAAKAPPTGLQRGGGHAPSIHWNMVAEETKPTSHTTTVTTIVHSTGLFLRRRVQTG